MATAAARPLAASTLPIVSSKIYHLSVKAEDVSADVVVVQDPDLVPLVAKEHLLLPLQHEASHRGLRTVTGIAACDGRTRVTVVSSGIGHPSLEIVVSELAALLEIDLATRMPLDPRPREPSSVNMIHVGEAVAPTLEAGASRQRHFMPTVATLAVGLDNTGLFYDATPALANDARECKEAEDKVTAALEKVAKGRFSVKGRCVRPYAAKADRTMVAALLACCPGSSAAPVVSVPDCYACTPTRTGPGNFLAPSLTFADLGSAIVSALPTAACMDLGASLFLHLMGTSLGYRCGALAVPVPPGPPKSYHEALVSAAGCAISALCRLHQPK